ncbi:MAG: hypothetical protein HYX41_07805 [Bdellovibrio sp.]|nr:hypothetical protein [Bdellovibrio sp.]
MNSSTLLTPEIAVSESEVLSSKERETKNTYPDRVKISAEAIAKLNNLAEQVNSQLRGVKLTRCELVDFLLLSHSESLSASELKDLEAKYFDEVKFAQWAVEELKRAKARGESVSFADILSERSVKATRPKSKPRFPEKPTEVAYDG